MVQMEALAVVPQAIARATGAVGLRWDGDQLVVGFPESLTEEVLVDTTNRLRRDGVPKVRAMRVPDEELRELLDYALDGGGAAGFDALPSVTDGAEGPIAELVSQIIDRAVRLRASDVHIEPNDVGVVVRVRVDGELEELTRQPLTVAAPIVSRLKVLAGMNIMERRLPQDGQFTLTVSDREIDVRIATVATMYGEKTALRLLDTHRPNVDITSLGMRGHALEDFNHMLTGSYGMIIAAGPTGAGKTTTMQCALHAINSPGRNVSTLEDPVEYVVPGVNHIPVNEGIGAGFATQLRALLRQDPDVILIGEIRDSDTARIGVQAALSGRLVLTSLHAQDAVSTISRLVQLNVDPHLVAVAMRGVVAQRLLRRICRFCADGYVASPAERLLLDLPSHGADLWLRRGVGCALCRGTGYHDRIAAFQVLNITDDMRDLIADRAPMGRVYDLARANGLATLSEEALELAREGITTLEEAMRLVGNDG